ncbi:TlpA disulfide reductase family protein [Aurantimonas sp. 22II-16-19i]|uniref:TlpA family protein disulfide reductase n=1 Tax=Aurantimonas sp. 22II-16-19i TaxID=1317114 RepID=UPI0009F7D6FD|nr:TlpA disulfide reductase family protein [Aurantimonas sp. 22II-16-19i]ORE97015.1 thiol:disulfide interchange protein TlpA [Aurantimonas sp. 22II-16-19i]
MKLKTFTFLAIAGGVFALAAGAGYHHYAGAEDAGERAPSPSMLSASATEAEDGVLFPMHETPQAVPDLRFVDGDGRETSLSAFEGTTILLNVWATWCVPCREEMPALDRLEAKLGSAAFRVVPLSIDRGGLEKVKAFYRELGLKALPIYVDETGKASQQLATIGIPTTLLIGREGQELGRLVGPAEWDSPDMTALLQQHIGSTAAAVNR